MTKFAELGLAEPILRAISEQGYDTPTPIQLQAIPVVLSGGDVMAAAQTGTGKTAGFTLPMLQRLSTGKRASSNSIRALVLTPTRELAAQVAESVRDYGKHLNLRSAVVFGGVSINPQMKALRGGVDILVATPGRLMDLFGQNAVKFNEVEMLVLDEADRMLDMGFIRDIRKILALLPKQRQNLLFSATFSDDIVNLTKGLLNNPTQISVAARNTTAQNIAQSVYLVDKSAKTSLLTHLVKTNEWEQVLVFTRTKHGANRLAEKLAKNGITAAAIHGNKSQGARTKALADFKASAVRVLVATDIAARGLDIEQLPHVVNFELPNVSEDYVHRIGRTGRAGATGEAVSLVEPEENKYLKSIERLINKTLPRLQLPEFINEPDVNIDREPRRGAGQRPQRNKPQGQAAGAGRGRSDGAAQGRARPEGQAGRKRPDGASRGGQGRPAAGAGAYARPAGNGGQSRQGQTANGNTAQPQRARTGQPLSNENRSAVDLARADLPAANDGARRRRRPNAA